MADGGQLQTREPAGPEKGVTVHAAPEPLESIYVYVNHAEADGQQGGTVRFRGRRGTPVDTQLAGTLLPAGSWRATVGRVDGLVMSLASFEFREPQAHKQAAEAQLQQALDDAAKQGEALAQLYRYAAPTAEQARQIIQMQEAAVGLPIRIVVSYSPRPVGNPPSLTTSTPLLGGDTNALEDPEVAALYLAFVQHFGDRTVDLSLAQDGLTEDELDSVEQGRPEIMAITDLFLQAFGEFEAVKAGAPAPAVTLENFRAMAETIFFQKAAGNDLAARNKLAIALGKRLEVDGQAIKSVTDIGVAQRDAGNDVFLLYDRHGAPVLGNNPHIEHRNIDMNAPGIPSVSVTMSDAALYQILRSLEQQLGDPTRQALSLAVNLFKHTDVIVREIQANGTLTAKIKKEILDCRHAVLAFFVAHAMLAPLLASGHPAGPVLLLLLRGAGFLMGIEPSLASLGKVLSAGREFHRVEFLDRKADDEPPARTELSQQHLERGAALLIDAMAEAIAGGVVVVIAGAGNLVLRRPGRALLEGLRRANQARLRLFVRPKRPPKPGETPKDFEAERIESITPRTTVPTTTTQPAPAAGAGQGKKSEAPSKTEQLATDDGPANRRARRTRKEPPGPRPRNWNVFDERFDEEFIQRLKAFRGDDVLTRDTTLAGGEGQLFRSPSQPDRALKRWFRSRTKDMAESVDLLKQARAATDAHPVVKQHLEVVRVHEQGSDWIVRDFHPGTGSLTSALALPEAAQARAAAIQALQATADPALAEVLKKLTRQPPSNNLHWSGTLRKIVVIDLM